MNKLTTAKRVAVVGALVEGMAINAVCRMTGVSKPTVLKLLADLGKACLTTKRVQCDEIWSFVYARKKNVPREPRPSLKEPRKLTVLSDLSVVDYYRCDSCAHVWTVTKDGAKLVAHVTLQYTPHKPDSHSH